MTWSIVARAADGALGLAIASRALAVGGLCLHARSGVGALSTQALVNPLYGEPGLRLLAQGTPPDEVVRLLTAPDEGREHRQLHLVDACGRTAAYTGSGCIDWCGQLAGRHFSVAGNMLAGPDVLQATARTYEAGERLPFAERLLAAMDAGEAAGGDKRGRQAGALRICTDEDYPWLDLRVDDHADPLPELRRLYERSFERYRPLHACLPSRARPSGVVDRTEVEAFIARFQAARAKPPA